MRIRPKTLQKRSQAVEGLRKRVVKSSATWETSVKSSASSLGSEARRSCGMEEVKEVKEGREGIFMLVMWVAMEGRSSRYMLMEEEEDRCGR